MGGVYYEPPYTEEKELELYGMATAGPFPILHAPKKPKTKDNKKGRER